MNSRSKINIAIVDDEELIISLLVNFFDVRSDVQVCCTSSSGEEFIERLPSLPLLPEIVILDLKMKKLSGIDVMKFISLSYPDIKVIIMSSFYKRSFMGFMLKTGASAFIPKNISTVKLVEVISEVKNKGYFFMSDQMDVIRIQLSSKTPKPKLIKKNVLSPRETEVLKLVCLQRTAKEIAEELFLTRRTVEGHKNKLFLKTNAKNIAGLVIYAVQNNYISLDEIPMI